MLERLSLPVFTASLAIVMRQRIRYSTGGNPDLPARFTADAPLAELDWPKVYGPTAAGYTDYPTLEAQPA